MPQKASEHELFMRYPLRNCSLRCDPFMRLLVGGTYGYTRGSGKQFHGGIDLYAKEGTDCFAIYKGRVEWVHDFESVGWGLTILTRVLFPKWSCWALYGHLSTVLVKKGTPLQPGTLLGKTGISGNGDSRYPHLHFEIWTSLQAGTAGTREKYRLDPLAVLGPLPFEPFGEKVIEEYNNLGKTIRGRTA